MNQICYFFVTLVYSLVQNNNFKSFATDSLAEVDTFILASQVERSDNFDELLQCPPTEAPKKVLSLKLT